MPILLNCACGKQLRVPDEFAGKRIKCPACGEVQTVANEQVAAAPGPRAPARAAAGLSEPTRPATIRFSCECGKVMQAKAEFAGRTTRCPSCQSTILIPETDAGPGAESGIRADRPAARPAARTDNGDDFDEDEEPIRKGKRGRKKGKSKTWLWVSLAAAGLLLLVVGGVGGFLWPGWFRSASVPAEMALVPDNTQMVVTARVGDIWNLELTKKLLKEVPMPPGGPADLGALAEKHIGMSPADVERVTFVALNLPSAGGMGPPGFGGAPAVKGFIIVKTTKGYDKQKLVASVLGPNPTETKHKDKAFQLGQGSGLYFVDDHTFVIGNQEGIQKCIEQQLSPTKPKGELAEALKAAGGKDHVLVWVKVPQDMVQPLKNQAPPDAKALLEIKDVLCTVNLGNSLALDVTLGFDSGSKASAAKKSVDDGMKQVKQQSAMLGVMMMGQPKEVQDWGNKLIKALDNMVIEQKGSGVHLGLKMDLDADALVKSVKSLLGNVKGAAENVQDSNNLKQIALALHMYHDTHGHFPPAVIYSQDGKKPLYSWRVELLPYLEQGALYQEFKKDEPWDSPNNIKLVNRMPSVYSLPGVVDPPGMTHYQVFTSPPPAPNNPAAPFGGNRMLKMTNISDGTSNTIAVAEAQRAVRWTEPVDLAFSAKGPLPPLGARPGNTFFVAMFDGSVKAVKKSINPEELKKAITHANGDSANLD